MYRTKHVLPRVKGEPEVSAPQKKLKNYDQAALSKARLILIGGGGMGTEIAEALVRKGVGTLTIFDHDAVELSNINRQFFFEEDLGKPKAHCLAANLSAHGFLGSVIEGYSLCFEDALAFGIDVTGTVAVVAVDNSPARIAASVYYREQNIPSVFCAVSEDASHGYVFVQEPGKACFGCQFPDDVNDQTYPCPGTPAIKDILKVVGGIVSYTVDSLLMQRLRCWQYMEIFLDGSVSHRTGRVEKRPDCKLCGVHIDETLSGCVVSNAAQIEEGWQ